MRFLFQAALAATLAAGAVAQSPLTTAYQRDNGGAFGGAVYFDLTPNVDLEISAFDINSAETVSGFIDVYVRTGTYVGNTGSPAGWDYMAVGSGVLQGINNPSNMTLNRPICLPAGQTYGIAIVAGPNFGHDYTGTGTTSAIPLNYTNAELTLDAGSGGNVPFSGSVFTPRVFNGSVYYATSPGCTPLPPLPPRPEATEMTGTVEQVAGAGTLSTANATFTDNDIIRVALGDPSGTNAGDFGAFVLNVGVGGPAALGSTPAIPGFGQLWAGSTPAGVATVYTTVVGGPDQSFTIPAGLFGQSDTVRFQGLVLEPTLGGAFPVLPTTNSVTYTFVAPLTPPPSCTIGEDFEGITASAGNYPTGWSNGTGNRQWEPQSGGTTSNPTGPTGARVGSQYMYTETSSPVAVGDVFEMISDTYTDQTVTQLQFYLSRFGSDIGQLDVFIDDGATLTPIGAYTGPDPGQSQGNLGLEWSLETLTLPSPLPASYNFVFRYTTLPVVQFTFYGDCAIDYFCLN